MPIRPPADAAASAASAVDFVGRQLELTCLTGALDRARGGAPQNVLVEGPAGIGKTRLVDQFLRRTENAVVLLATGDETETSLDFGVLDQLLAHAAASGRDLPGNLTERRAPGMDPFAAGAALVELLGVLQDRGPVAMVVDDVQWADNPSLRALTFTLRRLRVDRVMSVLLAREVTDPRLPEGLRRVLTDDRTLHLPLASLTVEELGVLSVRLGTGPLPTRAAGRLHAHTGGNPLHARALLEQLPREALIDLDRPLPAPRSFELLVLDRLATCPPEAQELVSAASVLGGRCPLDQAAWLADLAQPLPALGDAIAAGLLVEAEQPIPAWVTFPHPLVQAAVYQRLRPARRAALHRRAAELTDDEPAQLRHRLRAASGPDEQLAADLARSSRQQARAGAWASAAEQLAAAARLTGSPATRDQLGLEAIEAALLAGDLVSTDEATARVRRFPASSWRSYLLGRLLAVTGQLAEAKALFDDAWRRCGLARDGEPALAARIAAQLASLLVTLGQGGQAARWAQRALQLAPDQVAHEFVGLSWVTGLYNSGQVGQAVALTAALPAPTVASTAELDLLLGRGLVRTWLGDLADSYRDVAGVLAVGHGRSAEFRILAASILGQAEYRIGRWDDAVVHFDLALSIAADADVAWLAQLSHAHATLVHAARGHWPAAEFHADNAQVQTRGDAPAAKAYAASALGHLARARARPEAVVVALEPLQTLGYLDGVTAPGVVPWQDLLADALTSLGHREQAEAVLQPFQARAVRHAHAPTMTAAARARGNLEAARGNHALADEAFQAGLGYATQTQAPFDRALLQLAYGGFLRRTGNRRAAVVQLEAARTTLVRLGAQPDLDRCDRELAACARSPGRRRPHDPLRLTPQETAVARLAAGGFTNQQIARDLVVSIKTVEYHLGKVYAKLGVAARDQLAARVGPPGDTLATQTLTGHAH